MDKRLIPVTEQCRAAHPFLVLAEEDEMEAVIGRFASLYAAAQTAMHSSVDAVVEHEGTGEQWGFGELIAIKLNSIIPLVFDRKTGVGRQSVSCLRPHDESV